MRQQKRSSQEYQDCRCHICGSYYNLELHHMIHGYGRRAQADKYGLTCYLCRSCHRLLHDTRMNDLELQQEAQAIFEKDHTREEFIKTFGKSYL